MIKEISLEILFLGGSAAEGAKHQLCDLML